MASSTPNGAQTLARGIAALELIAASEGLTVQELAEGLNVHRTIAYRMANTLADAGLVTRGEDARYRGSVGLTRLQVPRFEALRHAAARPLAQLADELAATVSLLVAEGETAVALLVQPPLHARYRVMFAVGDTHPLDQGSAGHALRAALPGYDDDPVVAAVRERGYSMTQGEVEPGAWGVGAPVQIPYGIAACVNVITYRKDVADQAALRVVDCARKLEQLLATKS